MGAGFREVVIGFVFAEVALQSHCSQHGTLVLGCLRGSSRALRLVRCRVTFHLPTGSAVAAAKATSHLHPVPQQQAVSMDDGIQPCGTAFFRRKSSVA